MTAMSHRERPLSERGPAIHTTVVVPSFNEEEGLPVVLERILGAVDEGTEVLVVDDGSTDRTRAIASQYPCRVVWHSQNQGKGEAVRTGIRYATGENLIFIDADDTYPADLIPAMIELLQTHEMVVGSRSTGHAHIPAFNRIGNAIFRNSIRYFYGFRPYDPLTGFFAIKRELIAALDLESDNFRIESELAIKAASRGVKMADLPIEYGRRLGTAKLRGLQDGYTIFETIVRMLPHYSPALALMLPGALAGLLAVTAAALFYGDGGSSPEAFLLALLVSLLSLQLVLGGAVLAAYGASRGILARGFIVRALSSTLMTALLLAIGGALVAGLAAWGLISSDEWRASADTVSAFENAQIVVAGAFAGLELIAVAFLLSLFRPRASTPVHGLQHVAQLAVESEEGIASD